MKVQTKPVSLITLITLVALLPVGNAYAHHSSTATYDVKKTIKLTGVVVKYELRSPHAHIAMDVKNAAGAVERWTVEGHAVGLMKRMGLDKDKLKPGDVITVIALPNRKPESRLVWLNQVTTADGTVASLAPRTGPGPAVAPRPGAVGIERLAGRWQMTSFDPAEIEKPETSLTLTRAGREAEKKYDPLRSPNLDCTLGSLPWMLTLPYLYELEVSGQEVIMHHELWDIRRRVSLNGKSSKADKAGLFGLVSGRVEGDALVVDSSGYPASPWGLAAAASPPAGEADIPSSAQKKVTERYSISADGNTLTLAYTVSDPVYLAKPYSDTETFARVPDETPMEFKCDVESANRFLK